MFASKAEHAKIWAIAWPMILANVATTLIGLVDTAILGHMEDPAFIGGAAVATSLFNIVYMSLAFLRMGTTGLVAQHFGEQTWQDLYATFCLSTAIAFLLGLTLIAVSPLLFFHALPVIGGSAEVQRLALEYANIRVLSSPAVLFNYVAVGCLIGIQRSRQALQVLLFSQLLNIILDFYLAVYLKWDIAGIAWATAISDYAGSLLAFFFLLRFFLEQKIQWKVLNDISEKFLRIFTLNRDLFFRTIVLISIFAFITAQSARQSDIILAANSILIQLFFFLANAVDGFANAAETKTGEVIGERRINNQDQSGDLSSIDKSISLWFSISLQQAFLMLLVTLTLLLAFSPSVIALISEISEITAASLSYINWLGVLLLCSVVCFVLDGVLVGATQGRAMLIAILSSTVLVFFPCFYLSKGLENHGLWLSLCVFMSFRSALTYCLYKRLQSQQWP